jgi:hypothetical protein
LSGQAIRSLPSTYTLVHKGYLQEYEQQFHVALNDSPARMIALLFFFEKKKKKKKKSSASEDIQESYGI